MNNTIKSSKEIETIFKTGLFYSSSLFTVRICETPKGRGPHGRVAFIAGKKTGNAVCRNKSKRVLREMVFRNKYSSPGFDSIFIANKDTKYAKPKELDKDFMMVSKRLNKRAV